MLRVTGLNLSTVCDPQKPHSTTMNHCQCFDKTNTKIICLRISNHFLNHLYSRHSVTSLINPASGLMLHVTFICSRKILVNYIHGHYWHTYPFVEEGDEAISFRFTCGHVFHHPTVPVDKFNTKLAKHFLKDTVNLVPQKRAGEAIKHFAVSMTLVDITDTELVRSSVTKHLRYFPKWTKSCFYVICGNFRTQISNKDMEMT